MEKSSIFFSTNVIPYNRMNICQLLSMSEADMYSKYLGLPNLLGQKKSVLLGFLKEKLENKIRVWERRPVSKAGQEILIKMVGQALPSYAMSVFLLPLDLIKSLEKMLTRYWWNSTQKGKNKIHWASWEKLCKHKSTGGLDFRDFRSFNIAMLGKQGWRFLTNSDSLVSRVYKAKYFKDGNFLDAQLGASPSFTWRSVWEAKEVVSAGVCWKIGSGENINITGQPWLANVDNSYISTVSESFLNCKVQGLMHTGSREWDQDVIRDLFNERDQTCILETSLGTNDVEDSMVWKYEKSGTYSVKSAYRLIQRMKGLFCAEERSNVLMQLWKIKAPPRVLNVVWRAVAGCLPTFMQLYQKRVQINTQCQVCSAGEESIFHILVGCPFASSCWNRVFPGFQMPPTQDFGTWLGAMFEQHDHNRVAELVSVCWALWRARNDVVWNRKYSKINRVIASAKQYLLQ